MSEVVTAYLGLGSNLGDREATLRSAIDHLNRTPGIVVEAASTFIETGPVGPPGQDNYLNAAIVIATTLSPRALLQECLWIEQLHGRDRKSQPRWGPRTLDIDVLMYGNLAFEEHGDPPLRVPHAHMTERLFVLEPLAQIAAEAVHPTTGLTIAALRDRLRSKAKAGAP